MRPVCRAEERSDEASGPVLATTRHGFFASAEFTLSKAERLRPRILHAARQGHHGR